MNRQIGVITFGWQVAIAESAAGADAKYARIAGTLALVEVVWSMASNRSAKRCMVLTLEAWPSSDKLSAVSFSDR